jgi:2-methylcitrate dehydratase PrpD
LRRALESKYSIYHAAAIGLIRGKGGLQEFTDAAVADPDLQRVRAVTTAVGDSSISEDQVHIEVVLRNGQTLTKFVEQSLGNVHKPLSNEQITEKFVDQAVLALPRTQVDAVVDQCWRIDTLGNAGDLARATVPRASAAARSGRRTH